MDIKRNFFVVLLIGISACVSSDMCPFIENLPDCWCVKMPDGLLRIHCNGFQTEKTIEDTAKLLKKSDFDKKKNTELIFRRFEGNKLPSRVFDGIHVTSLRIEVSKFSMWADEESGPAFVGLEDSLEKLVIYFSIEQQKSSAPAPMSLGHFRKLREVDLSKNFMNHFGNGWFGESDDSIEVLNLTRCKLGTIGDQAFASLKNLREIDLHYNNFDKLTRSMLPNPAKHLEKIFLQTTFVNVLPNDFFTNMPSLKLVNLEETSIILLPEVLWRPVWSNLDELNLNSTLLNCKKNIEWIFEVKPPKKIIGNCKGPKEYKGKSLEDLIKENQKN